MLMSNARSIFCSMRLIRPAPECHSEATPEALPCRKSGTHKEPTKAAASSQTDHVSPEGLMVSSERSSRPSNPSRSDARVAPAGLTSLSTSHPRACPEDLGSHGGGTLAYPHNPTTEIPGMRSAYPRMTPWLVQLGNNPGQGT